MHRCWSITLCTLFATLEIYEVQCSKVFYCIKAAPSAPNFFRRSSVAAHDARSAFACCSLTVDSAFASHSPRLRYTVCMIHALSQLAPHELGVPLHDILHIDYIYFKTSRERSVKEVSRGRKSEASEPTIFLNARFEIRHSRPVWHRSCTVEAPLMHSRCTVDAPLLHH